MKKVLLVLLVALFFSGCGDDPVSPEESETYLQLYPTEGSHLVSTYFKEKRNQDYPEIQGTGDFFKPIGGKDSLYWLIKEVSTGQFRTEDNVTAKWDSVYIGDLGNNFFESDNLYGFMAALDMITDETGLKNNSLNQLLHLNTEGIELYLLPANRQTTKGNDTTNRHIFYFYHRVNPS